MKKLKKQIVFTGDTGKLMLDLGKLVFGSVFLGGVLRGGVPQIILVISGFVVAIVCCFIGLLLIAKEKKIGENGDSPEKQG
jgi:hypothetical protein